MLILNKEDESDKKKKKKKRNLLLQNILKIYKRQGSLQL